jgi:hypothetical protein
VAKSLGYMFSRLACLSVGAEGPFIHIRFVIEDA